MKLIILGEIYEENNSEDYTNYEHNQQEEEPQEIEGEQTNLQEPQDRSSKPKFANNSNTIRHNFVRDSTVVDEPRKIDMTVSMSVDKNGSEQSKPKSQKSFPKGLKSNELSDKQKWSFEKNNSGIINPYVESKFQQSSKGYHDE